MGLDGFVGYLYNLFGYFSSIQGKSEEEKRKFSLIRSTGSIDSYLGLIETSTFRNLRTSLARKKSCMPSFKPSLDDCCARWL